MDKKHCRGCRNNYYNQGSNSTTGECWLLKTATLVERVGVGTWQTPPYRWVPSMVPSCMSADGTHFLKRDDSRVVADNDNAVEAWKQRVHGETR